MGCLGGVQLAQRARGGVARVDIGIQPLFYALAVVLLKLGERAEDLATQFHFGGDVSTPQAEWDAFDGAYVGGYILAGYAVAACTGAPESAVAVDYGYRQPVYFGFTDHLQQIYDLRFQGYSLLSVLRYQSL